MIKPSAVIARAFNAYLDQSRWLEWKEVDGNKVPFTPGTNRKAAVNKSASWRTLEECRSEQRGIVFNADGLGGVDLDGCRDPKTGAVAPWAMEIVNDFDSYAEVSPSGTGVKIFARGAPGEIVNHTLSMPGEPINGKRPQIEAYVNNRYFTVTGDRLPEAPDGIRETPESWARLVRHLEQQPASDKTQAAGRNAALFKLESGEA